MDNTSLKFVDGSAVMMEDGGNHYMEITTDKSSADLISQNCSSGYLSEISDHQLDKRHDSMATCSESQTPSTRRSPSSRHQVVLCFICLISVLMAATACVLIVKLWVKCEALEARLSSAQTSYTAMQQEPHVCLPCGDLAQGPFQEENPLLRTLLQHEEDGVLVCCAKTPSQLSTLLNLYAARKQLEKCAQELMKENGTGSCNTTGSNPPSPPSGKIVSAHVLAGVQSQESAGYQPIRNWITDDSTTHLTGVKMEHNRLIVPETGLYFLYSQIGFLIYYDDPSSSDFEARETLYHHVYRYNPIFPNGGNQELLRSVTTQCKEHDQMFGQYTSYAAGAIRLVKGDQLYVSVSKISAVIGDRKMKRSYFGLYKLGS